MLLQLLNKKTPSQDFDLTRVFSISTTAEEGEEGAPQEVRVYEP